MKDLKLVYGAVSKDAAETELDNLELKWDEQYPIVIKSWRDKWDRLTEFFQYTKDIRRLIYTTNTVEGYHRQIRKVTNPSFTLKIIFHKFSSCFYKPKSIRLLIFKTGVYCPWFKIQL